MYFQFKNGTFQSKIELKIRYLLRSYGVTQVWKTEAFWYMYGAYEALVLLRN